MWLLQYYVAALVATFIPVLGNLFMFFKPLGNKVFWIILGLGVLGAIASPFLMAAFGLDASLSVIARVLGFYVGWVLLTFLGVIVWGIFFIFVEIALAIFGSLTGIRFSLFKFLVDRF